LDASIKPFSHSDHDGVWMTLNFDQLKRGPGYWHFNNDLLSNAAFESEIHNFWTFWKTKYADFDDPLLWWDRAKQDLRTLQSDARKY